MVKDVGGNFDYVGSDKISWAVGDGMWLVCLLRERGESAKDHLHM